MRGGLKRRHPRRDVRQRHVELDRHRRRRQYVRQVRAADERRREVHLAARRRHARARSIDPAIDDRGRAHVGRPIDPERHDAAAESVQARRDQRIVGVRHEHVLLARAFEDLRLRVRDRADRREEAEVRLAHVRPDAHVRLGNPHERADLPRVVHSELDDGNLRPLPQLHERERQPDVIVEVPAVADDAVARRQQLAGHLLGRRLPGAAGDGDDLRARLPPNCVCQRLQSCRRVGDFDHDWTLG